MIALVQDCAIPKNNLIFNSQNIGILTQSPRSPDLNPIELVGIFKKATS